MYNILKNEFNNKKNAKYLKEKYKRAKSKDIKNTQKYKDKI